MLCEKGGKQAAPESCREYWTFEIRRIATTHPASETDGSGWTLEVIFVGHDLALHSSCLGAKRGVELLDRHNACIANTLVQF